MTVVAQSAVGATDRRLGGRSPPTFDVTQRDVQIGLASGANLMTVPYGLGASVGPCARCSQHTRIGDDRGFQPPMSRRTRGRLFAALAGRSRRQRSQAERRGRHADNGLASSQALAAQHQPHYLTSKLQQCEFSSKIIGINPIYLGSTRCSAS